MGQTDRNTDGVRCVMQSAALMHTTCAADDVAAAKRVLMQQ